MTCPQCCRDRFAGDCFVSNDLFVQKGQALDKLYEAEGGTCTYAGWVRKNLPRKFQKRIRANTFGPLKRDVARSWGRRLERLEYVRSPDSEQAKEALEQIAPYLGSVTWLRLDGSIVDDSSMVHLGELISIDELNLVDAKITDEGLIHLRNCKNLSRLNLNGTDISDRGLEILSKISKISTIRQLRVTADLTDTGLAHLANLPRLATLSLHSNSRITPEGIAHLKSLPDLQILSIHSPEFSDAEMAAVGELKNLTHLRVSGEGINNKGLAHLQSMKKLNDVYFESTSIADEGLPALYSLNGLDFVGFQDNKGGTKEAVAKFKKAVPGSRPVGGN